MFAIAAVPSSRRALRRLRNVPPRPSRRRLLATLAVLAIASVLSTIASTLAYLRLPGPTGTFAVGRTSALLVDGDRLEPRSPTGEPRAVRIVSWYPALPGTGEEAEYVPGYESIRDGLEASGELESLAIAGLPLVAPHARESASIAPADAAYPVIVLSPGNATNVAFYGSLAEDLASHGYVVVGIDHPYQVAAVDVGKGRVAVYEGDDGADRLEGGVAARIDERVADVAFVLDRLETDAAGIELLAGNVDLDHVGIAGHSNGGLAAAETCAADDRVVSCLNIDGQQAGGPFSSAPRPAPPTKPFLFLTKEVVLHPALAEVFEAGGPDTYRVVIPTATHESFTDGPRFLPRFAPVDGAFDQVVTVERSVVRAFFDRTLRDAPGAVFGDLEAATDVFVEVYPLGGRPNLPAG
jgi:dienelactone hydrolase